MLRRTLLAAGVAALALPAAASADATLTDTGAELVYQATQGDVDSFMLTSSGGNVFFLPVSGGVRVTSPTAGCANPPPPPGTGAASCPVRAAVTLRLEDGDDFTNIQGGPTVTFWGGTGNDRVFTVSSRLIAHGEAGNDWLQGGPGLDELDGGAGDDLLDPSSFGDVVSGGPGFDTARTSSAGVVVTLDDVANDGVPGDGQNIKSDVEKVAAGSGGDELEGNALTNTLSGGDGADTLTGNGGADVLLGDAGADTINARDGVADDVNCGPGADTAVVDPTDTVTSCETVNLPDADADGVRAPQDCDDENPAIHPGGTDVPGDGIDQDCTGADRRPLGPRPPLHDGHRAHGQGHPGGRPRRGPVLGQGLRVRAPDGRPEGRRRQAREALQGAPAQARRRGRDPRHRAEDDRQGRALHGPRRSQAAHVGDTLPAVRREQAGRLLSGAVRFGRAATS